MLDLTGHCAADPPLSSGKNKIYLRCVNVTFSAAQKLRREDEVAHYNDFSIGS